MLALKASIIPPLQSTIGTVALYRTSHCVTIRRRVTLVIALL